MSACVIYARQSLDNAEGIERQLVRCRQLAAARGWTVAQEYTDDGVSASKARGSGSAWADLLKSPVALVLAVDLDRLLRSQRDLLALIEAGKRVVTVDGEIDLSTADGEFRATMLAGIARFEARRKSERQTRAAAHRRTSGMPVAGRRRFGFLGADVAVGRKGNVYEHPTEGPQVRDIFTRFAQGVPSYALSQEYGMNYMTLRDILHNPAYVGMLRDGQGGWYEAHHSVARIVPRDIYDAAQAVFSDPARKVSPGGAVKYPASGLVHCAECGAKMRSRAENYICPADLSHPVIRRYMLDEALCWGVFDVLAREPESTELGALERLEDRLRAIAAERADATDLMLTPGIDRARVRARLAELADEADQVRAQAQSIRAEHVAAAVVSEVREALRSELTDSEGSQWWEARWAAMDLATQRELIRGLRVTVGHGRSIERVQISAR